MSDETKNPAQGKGTGVPEDMGPEDKLAKAFIDAGLALFATSPGKLAGGAPRGCVVPFIHNGTPMVVLCSTPVHSMRLLAAAMDDFVDRNSEQDPMALMAALMGRAPVGDPN